MMEDLSAREHAGAYKKIPHFDTIVLYREIAAALSLRSSKSLSLIDGPGIHLGLVMIIRQT